MKSEDVLLFGGLGLVAYLIYQSASSAADVLPNLFSSVSSAVTGAVQTAGSSWNCGDMGALASMPFGSGALSVPDSYVVPCAGGATVGMMRATGASNNEIIQSLAAAECSCAAAQMPGSGVTVKNNVIVPDALSGYRRRLPAGVVRV